MKNNVIDNPAQRLFDVLMAVSKIGSNRTNLAARGVWCSVLNVPHENEALLLYKLSRVAKLPEDCIEGLAELNVNTGPHHRWVSEIKNGFSKQDLGQPVSSFLKAINSNNLEKIEACAQIFSMKLSNVGDNKDELQQLINELNERIEEIAGNGFSDALKVFLTKSFEKIISTIRDFRILGPGVLIEEIEKMLGKIGLDPELRNDFKAQEDAQSMFWTVVEKVAVVTGAAQAIPLLCDLSAEGEKFAALSQIF